MKLNLGLNISKLHRQDCKRCISIRKSSLESPKYWCFQNPGGFLINTVHLFDICTKFHSNLRRLV